VARKSRIKLHERILSGLAVLLVAGIFIGLGNWQLDRARELKTSTQTIVTVAKPVELTSLAKPRVNIDARNLLKNVSTQGHYIATFKSDNQVSDGVSATAWEVGVLQVDANSAILVVRGLWADRLTQPQIAMSQNVSVTGVLQPSQSSDHGPNTADNLARIDSTLLLTKAGLADFDLYDGFILANSEVVDGTKIDRTRLEIAVDNSKVPGYYWQHISYVFIWWLMAALVLYLPFYRRRVTS
jgi:cytochrome oxidase assembly protein ShyY1